MLQAVTSTDAHCLTSLTSLAYGRLNPLRPEKVKAILLADDTLEWASNDFPLYNNNIVGPFDFTTQRIPMQPPLNQSVRQHHCVDDIHWIKLEQLGRAAGISDKYLTKIRTLPEFER